MVEAMTKPRGIYANFATECVHCRGEIVYRDGRQERHECQPQTPTIYEVADVKAFYNDTMARLKTAFDNL